MWGTVDSEIILYLFSHLVPTRTQGKEDSDTTPQKGLESVKMADSLETQNSKLVPLGK
jgi:hypothetical protein